MQIRSNRCPRKAAGDSTCPNEILAGIYGKMERTDVRRGRGESPGPRIDFEDRIALAANKQGAVVRIADNPIRPWRRGDDSGGRERKGAVPGGSIAGVCPDRVLNLMVREVGEEEGIRHWTGVR